MLCIRCFASAFVGSDTMIPLRLVIFGLTVNSIWIGVTDYLYKRLTGPYDLNPLTRNLARALATFVALIVPSAFLTRLVRDWSGQQTVAYLGFATMGSIGALATLLIVRDVALWLWGRWHAFSHGEPANPERRQFLIRASPTGVAVTSAGIAAAGLRGDHHHQ